MKPMFSGFAAIVVIGVVAWYGLGLAGFSAQDRQSGENVRVD